MIANASFHGKRKNIIRPATSNSFVTPREQESNQTRGEQNARGRLGRRMYRVGCADSREIAAKTGAERKHHAPDNDVGHFRKRQQCVLDIRRAREAKKQFPIEGVQGPAGWGDTIVRDGSIVPHPDQAG